METIIPINKSSRADEILPFLKLSNGTRNAVRRGWLREAAISFRHQQVRATMFSAQLGVINNFFFLHNRNVGFSNCLSVMRHDYRQRIQEILAGIGVQIECVPYFNAVDKSDYDSGNYSASI